MRVISRRAIRDFVERHTASMGYIRGTYTHKEYDEGDWKYGCESI